MSDERERSGIEPDEWVRRGAQEPQGPGDAEGHTYRSKWDEQRADGAFEPEESQKPGDTEGHVARYTNQEPADVTAEGRDAEGHVVRAKAQEPPVEPDDSWRVRF